MITLSNDFNRRAALGDSNRILVAKLYYSDTDYLLVATHSCLIGSRQAYGVLTSVEGSSSKWNLFGENNNVSVSSPSLVLAKYTAPDGYNLLEEFAQNSFIGRKVEIFAGFEDQEIEDMVPFVNGIVDEVNQKLSEIELVLENADFVETDISGRKIDYYANSIGTESNYNYHELFEKANDRRLPVVFGKQWCSPIIPIGRESTSSGIVYAVHDNKWLNLALYPSGYADLFTINDYVSKQYQFNRNISGYMLYGIQKEMFVPYYETNYSGQTTWIVEKNSAFDFPSFKITRDGLSASQSVTTLEEAVFCEVPLRYTTISGASYSHYVSNGTIYGSDGNLFSYATTPQIVISGNSYTTSNTPSQALIYRWNGQLDLNKNIRTDLKGRIRKTRRISIPEVDEDNIEALETVLYGKIKVVIESGYAGHSTNPVIINNTIVHINNNFGFFTLRGHNFNGTAPTTSGTFNEDTYLYYIGAYATANGTDLSGDNLLYVNSNTVTSGNYQYITRTGNANITPISIPNYGGVGGGNRDVYRIYEAGQYGSDERTKNLGRLRRNALVWPINTRFEISGLYLGRPRIDLYNLYAGYSYKVDTPYDKFLYTDVKAGAYAYYTNHMASLSGLNSNYYILRRPVEYIDAMIRQASGQINQYDASWRYSSVYPKWSGLYSNWRDYSGGVLTEETTLNSFIKDYIKNELFTTYIDENGKYRFLIIASGYSVSDLDGDLDYEDATNFEISLTPTENIKCAIKSLQTDRMIGMEDNEYLRKIGWRLDDTQYNYQTYDIRNSVSNNKFFYDEIKKPFTSSIEPDIVLYSGVLYSANITNSNVAPSNTVYWTPIISSGLVVSTDYTTWNSSTKYKGEDGENYIIAKRLLNWYANRHREITFETEKLEYTKYQIGDIIGVQNMPESCLGYDIRGFGSNSHSFSMTVNNQTFYSAFIINSVKKGLNKIILTATQLCDLNAYNIVPASYGRSFGGSY